jgi:uncharacterized membrane protein
VINQAIDVLYSKSNSQDAEIDNVMSIWGLPTGIFVFGLIFFLIGTGITYKEYARKGVINSLLSAGVKVQAKFLRTERYSPNGQKRNSAYRMILQFTENNQNYTFFSDHIPYNPASLVKTDLIDVYIDPLNYKNYYVDLSALPDKYSSNSENVFNSNKPSRPLTWITVLWKIVNVMIFLYIASITYHNLKINGVNYGVYLSPIAALPPYPFIIMAFVTHYFLQKQDEKAAINVSTMKSDLLQISSELINQNPVKTFQKYLWNSVKIIVKNGLIFFFLMIPIMMVFSIIQMILTGGNGDITATY